MSIDWSTAPEGATCYASGDFFKGSGLFVYVFSNGRWKESSNSIHWIVTRLDYELRQIEWPTEERISNIGQNGGDGLHYMEIATKSATEYLSQGMKILSERGKEYSATGEERSFPQVAQAFTAITGRHLSGSDVCLILNLVKKVRQYAQPNRLHEDSLVDAVNYDALWCQELAKELSE